MISPVHATSTQDPEVPTLARECAVQVCVSSPRQGLSSLWKKAGMIAFEIVQEFKHLSPRTDAQRYRWLQNKIKVALKKVRMERHPYNAGRNRAFDEVIEILDGRDNLIEKIKNMKEKDGLY